MGSQARRVWWAYPGEIMIGMAEFQDGRHFRAALAGTLGQAFPGFDSDERMSSAIV